MKGLFVEDFLDFTVFGDTVQIEFAYQPIIAGVPQTENSGASQAYYLFMPLQAFEKLAISASKVYAAQLDISNNEANTLEKLGRALPIPDQRY